MEPTDTPHLEVAFPLRGKHIPVDHGYPLFAALSRRLPELHRREHWSILPIRGHNRGRGTLALTDTSSVRIRLPGDQVTRILPLAGEHLDLAGHPCTLDVPRLYPLAPCPRLRSRLVLIKNFAGHPNLFIGALRRQLHALPGIDQDPEHIPIHLGSPRKLRIKGILDTGFPVHLANLAPATSIAIQTHGLGGRRHMSAGVFIAAASSSHRTGRRREPLSNHRDPGPETKTRPHHTA